MLLGETFEDIEVIPISVAQLFNCLDARREALKTA
jgi:hypothetical protein